MGLNALDILKVEACLAEHPFRVAVRCLEDEFKDIVRKLEEWAFRGVFSAVDQPCRLFACVVVSDGVFVVLVVSAVLLIRGLVSPKHKGPGPCKKKSDETADHVLGWLKTVSTMFPVLMGVRVYMHRLMDKMQSILILLWCFFIYGPNPTRSLVRCSELTHYQYQSFSR